jgi:hypothetical protein
MEEVPAAGANYPALRREFLLVRLRQQARALCDAAHLGPSTGERFACAVIVGVVPFAVSFGLAFAFREPAGLAVVQGVLAYLIVAAVLSLLVTVGTDGALDARRVQLARELPAARAAWAEQRELARLERARAAEEARRRREEEAEEEDEERREAALARRRPEPREYRGAPAVHVHVHGGGPRGGVAALLEVVFGLLLGTFGIGHMYAGHVVTGLFLMFGWWLFVFVNLLLCCTGLWIPVALVLVPSCWLLLLLFSPLLAAISAAEP